MVKIVIQKVSYLGVILVDKVIDSLINEEKHVDKQITLADIKFKHEKGHRRYDKEITGVNKSIFILKIRQNEKNPLDFSVILAYHIANSNKVFRLRRYNGKSHNHSNCLEKTQIKNTFHIHYATERYQISGFQEDGYAQITDRYSDLDGALKCMMADCHFTFNQTVIN